MNRREYVTLIGAAFLAGFQGGRRDPVQGPRSAQVALRRARYEDDLTEWVLQGFAEHDVDVRGARVLLKPHLSTPGRSTHPAVVAAAYAAVEEMGVARVWIGDDASADSYWRARAAGYRERIPNFDDVWVDLGADDVVAVQGFLGQGELYLPETAARADLVVSLGKLRTDGHYPVSGAITNLFGLLPRSVYGSPQGMHPLGTAAAMSELVRVFRRSFGIVDGIVGVEGSGDVREAGLLAVGRDLVAVDATCGRVIGLDPKKIDYLRLAAAHGVVAASGIEQTGEKIDAVRTAWPRVA